MDRCGHLLMDVPSRAGGCSGKCHGYCERKPLVWVIAACEGLIAVFQRSEAGELEPVEHPGGYLPPDVEVFRQFLTAAAQQGEFGQLLLVGATSDIAWLRLSLPPSPLAHVVAEVIYPLVAGWFQEAMPLPSLKQALDIRLAS